MMQPQISLTEMIFERTQKAEAGFLDEANPTILSCGGIYIPRRKLPAKIVYHVLNLANEKEPIKIYTGRSRMTNFLQQVLAKESMN